MAGSATATGHRADRTGVALTALSAVFFGSLAIFGKEATRLAIPLTELLAIRFGAAAAMLWILAVVRRERLWWGRRTAALVAMGLLYVGQAATYFISLQTVPAAVTSILLYLYPVVVMLLAAVFLGERIGWLRVAALALAIGGVFLVVDPLGVHGTVDRRGVLFGFATAAIYATYILTGRALMRDISPTVATATLALTAAVTFSIAGAVTGQPRPLSGDGYALALAMALVATAIPATLLLAGLARVGATRTAIISTLEPAMTVLLAALVLGEDLGPVRLAGGAVVLIAALTVARTGRGELQVPPVRD